MRRSKSDPSKYARNYRSISQRRMTQYDENADEEKEIERLRSVLRNSQRQVQAQEDRNDKKRKEESSPSSSNAFLGIGSGNSATLNLGNNSEGCNYSSTTTENPLIVIPTQKKKKAAAVAAPVVQLTPLEIKQAKLLQKNTSRKLEQLEKRATQKRKRAELYQQLEKHSQAVPKDSLLPLLSSSGNLSRKSNQSLTKKQMLKKILRKERAGIELTEEEKELLYPEKAVNEDTISAADVIQSQAPEIIKERGSLVKSCDVSQPSWGHGQARKKRQKKTQVNGSQVTKRELATPSLGEIKSNFPSTEISSSCDGILGTGKVDEFPKPSRAKCKQQDDPKAKTNAVSTRSNNSGDLNSLNETFLGDDRVISSKRNDKHSSDQKLINANKTAPTDFAAQMMASLSKLKQETTGQQPEENNGADGEMEVPPVNQIKNDSPKKYVPTSPTVLKTAATLGVKATHVDVQRRVVPITRPDDVERLRYDLPVSAMEFEIVDAIRNNDVTIVCGETGSGKSTQVCQFLYEAGFCVSPSSMPLTNINGGDTNQKSLIIGITQPRRVAAVSTAKRVCYEMGCGNGQSIRNAGGGRGNLVAYKTRYESAGMGSDTSLLFATDGILLQEIQDDLLLRRYSVIVLDETHERNLNTDVLIGLLSLALPLRKKAAEEDKNLTPLKLVLMSATLRVEDFTKNSKLFQSTPPAVIRVPGRTFPVTIHHSKVTELDDYESAAYSKVCKMHRKLPHGGILVFLTGKQEIVRMVNRLRKALNSTNGSIRNTPLQDRFTGSNDVVQIDDDGAPREVDDEEVDGDEDDALDSEHELEESANDIIDPNIKSLVTTDGENRPSQAHVLPLYSMLSTEDQAKVFAPTPENHRLIVVCTNIAETSITIPGISYVVDTGRQKCRNYNSGTGVVSYDIMWISKAAADQRAGRAGRTGPGHCYRLYSSSLYSRHMDKFAVPEVLTRPLEDVVLAMKALKISDVARFPFPTPPNSGQIKAAVNLLANIGCLDISNVERDGGDGTVTKLGEAISKLPLGVRYGKMLLVSAQAGVLDYAITMVAVLSESSPFLHGGQHSNQDKDKYEDPNGDKNIGIDSEEDADQHPERRIDDNQPWRHRGGDILAAMLAVGAYTYAGRGAGGATEQMACRRFCEENRLNYVTMTRVQKLRSHLARLAKLRLRGVDAVASKTGGFLSTMKPPNRLQENLLMQAIASGLLDNIALLAPQGSISGDHPFSLRSAYLSCSLPSDEPLFMDRNSVMFSRDFRQLPQWVCYDSVVKKTASDGTPLKVMKKITPVDPSWIGAIAKGSQLLVLGAPLPVPTPHYDKEKDAVMCSVVTKFGSHGWELPPVKREMFETIRSGGLKQRNTQFTADDSFRWFARFLLEGKVVSDLRELHMMLNDSPAIITRHPHLSKVGLLVSELSNAGVDSATALRMHWAKKDNKFLFKSIKSWIKSEYHSEAKKLWITTVKKNILIMAKEPIP